MKNYWERKEEERKEWKKHSATPANTRLRIASICSLVLAMLLMIAVLILTLNDASETHFTTLLYLRCFAGLFALIGSVLYMTLYYRVSKSSLQSRWSNKK